MEKTHRGLSLRSAEVQLLEENIVQVITAPDHDTTVQDVIEINDAVQSLVGKNNYGLLVITTQGSGSTPEAKEFAAQESYRKNVVAQAIVISNLALRFMATVYMKVNRPKQKIKLFNTEESALKWLRAEMGKHRK